MTDPATAGFGEAGRTMAQSRHAPPPVKARSPRPAAANSAGVALGACRPARPHASAQRRRSRAGRRGLPPAPSRSGRRSRPAILAARPVTTSKTTSATLPGETPCQWRSESGKFGPMVVVLSGRASRSPGGVTTRREHRGDVDAARLARRSWAASGSWEPEVATSRI
jgi:hypothetical protein